MTSGALAQLGAHHTGSVGVRGSSPLCSTRITKSLSASPQKDFFFSGFSVLYPNDHTDISLSTNFLSVIFSCPIPTKFFNHRFLSVSSDVLIRIEKHFSRILSALMPNKIPIETRDQNFYRFYLPKSSR